jgi:hypothetical protein
MRCGHFLKAILSIGWLAASLAGVVQAQAGWSFPDFSATQIFHMRQADMHMKVYLAGSSVRLERSGALSTLYVPATGKVYNLTIYPDQSRTCVAMRAEEARMLPTPLELIQGKIWKRTSAGSEVVEGHPTKIEDVEVAVAGGTTIASRVWEAEDLKGIPVQIESHLEHSVLRAVYRDIVLSEPDPARFTVPERCTPFEKMWQVADRSPGK